MNLRIESLTSIADIDAGCWNDWLNGYPFLRHEFLSALESSGATCQATGWVPMHLVAWDDQRPIAALPLFAKHHSRGEYVFDWGWADAFERAGGDYYPKLLSAAPFTPATGPRLLGDPRAHPALLAHIDQLIDQGFSSWHCLFPAHQIEGDDTLRRIGVQYHWHNQGYADFAEFLAPMTSKRRKAIRRERRIVADQGITLERIAGECAADADIEAFYRFYQNTYAVRGQRGYLNADAFKQMFHGMGDQLCLVMARMDQQAVGAALLFHDATTLYGRYWGGHQLDCLHFEACYYQGIEFAIERGLERFDPGAQGEHKIPRGFAPTQTQSFHRIGHPGFRAAVAEFLGREQGAVERWQSDAAAALPFKIATEDAAT
ncbi:GNAT family N-acetyltransferase [Litorivicinus lipolyticus]|uniref:GNAT family N-acetyltransferase n=1 Tax=Litorivicinus lipolyticus TaxID=418701 RepID=A0A5Q2QC69_9GAMM|nr:GNAT family N-acetyltransferase [Litorivicinus lipolyticus]QGG80704.1 GNAT family N-acetyltransferase [Litorivicinus lipolyticus]